MPLVALSGIDGAGKSTQVGLLAAAVGGVAVKARLTALQGVLALAEHRYGDPHAYHPHVPATLREFTVACDLLAWSRDTLAPLRASGAVLVADRSPLCYAAYARAYGADTTWTDRLLALVEQPDLVLLLDLDPDEAVARVRQRAHQPLQSDEDPGLLRDVRAACLELAAGRDDVVVLDAARPVATVAAEVLAVVRSRVALPDVVPVPSSARTPGQGRYAQPEPERRFLVRGPVPPAGALLEVEDRYVRGTTLRLRRVLRDGEVVHKLTQKVRTDPADPTSVRTTTAYLTAEEHAVLAALPADVVRKARRLVRDAGVLWAVDRHADGSEVAETAAPGPAALPAWVGREVTHDERWTGSGTAVRPPR